MNQYTFVTDATYNEAIHLNARLRRERATLQRQCAAWRLVAVAMACMAVAMACVAASVWLRGGC